MPVLDKGTQVGPFEILDVVKRGGMAQVYHARHRSKHNEVALKINLTHTRTAQQNSNSLRQEVDLLTSLNHLGIVRPQLIHLEGARDPTYMARAFQIDGQPWYYVMEYLRGGSLEKHIQDLGALPFNLSALLMWRVAATLEYLHSRKVAHLDIKPDNIVLRYPLKKHERIEPVLIGFWDCRAHHTPGCHRRNVDYYGTRVHPQAARRIGPPNSN
jgi:serine/threonine protein kinase